MKSPTLAKSDSLFDAADANWCKSFAQYGDRERKKP